jgi:hypothetical protein
MSQTQVIRYEHAATYATIKGWCCKRCKRYYGKGRDAKHMARWCCATDLPCRDCKKVRIQKHRIYCNGCQEKRDLERWEKMDTGDWDGVAALALWNTDTYFFRPDDLIDYLADRADWEDESADGTLRLMICRRVRPPAFCLADHCHDYLSEDTADDFYTDAIDTQVNQFIADHFPVVWEQTNVRASLESVQKALAPDLKKEVAR